MGLFSKKNLKRFAKGAAIGFATGGVGGALTGGSLGVGLPAVGGALKKAYNSLDTGNNEFRQVNRDEFNVPGFDEAVQSRQQLAEGAQGRMAAKGFERAQGRLAGILEAQARGEGPSVSGMMFDQAAQRGLAQQQALAATGRGNPAMAARVAAQNSGNLTGQLAGQAAIGRIQERQAAQGLLGQVLSQGREAGLQQQGLNDAQQRDLLRQELELRGMQQQGGMAAEAARTARFDTLTRTPSKTEKLISGLTGLTAAASNFIPGKKAAS